MLDFKNKPEVWNSRRTPFSRPRQEFLQGYSRDSRPSEPPIKQWGPLVCCRVLAALLRVMILIFFFRFHPPLSSMSPCHSSFNFWFDGRLWKRTPLVLLKTLVQFAMSQFYTIFDYQNAKTFVGGQYIRQYMRTRTDMKTRRNLDTSALMFCSR